MANLEPSKPLPVVTDSVLGCCQLSQCR